MTPSEAIQTLQDVERTLEAWSTYQTAYASGRSVTDPVNYAMLARDLHKAREALIDAPLALAGLNPDRPFDAVPVTIYPARPQAREEFGDDEPTEAERGEA